MASSVITARLREGAIRVPVKKLPGAFRATKRGLDIALSIIGLLISTPILLVTAVAIRVDSPGSVIFKQIRGGKGGKPFILYKFRGMYHDARQRFPELYDYSNKTGLNFHFHKREDPRITRVGRFIRKTSIDELPNLFNVLKGDMSIVGPRPEIPEVLALYGERMETYLSVTPGISCLSKATLRDHATKDQLVQLDCDYVDNMSLRLDLWIIIMTVRSVLFRTDNVYY